MPPPDDKSDDIKVKQLLDGDKSMADVVDLATQRELQKWFELPSFEQVGAQQPIAEDPELVEGRERRAKACAAVDPLFLELIHVRTEVTPETLLHNTFHIDVHVDPSIVQFDIDAVERQLQHAEPREVEISEELKDDLKDCTPQALLRDLHRPELMFEKLFEVIDIAAEQKLDIVAEVDAAMKMNLKLPPLGLSPFEEERRLLVQDRANRRLPWIKLRNRTVTD
jgi:hypothetical protein